MHWSNSRQLPEHVPKVNSKWDGLPEDARKKLENERKRSHETGSLFTTNTRQSRRSDNSSSSSSNSTRRPIGSMSSRPSSMDSAIRAGHKFTVIAPHLAYDTTTAIAVHPDLLDEPSPMEPGSQQQYFSHVPSPMSPELAALYQQSSPVELLQNFQAMGQLNFPAKNRHRWLATNRHISLLLAHRH